MDNDIAIPGQDVKHKTIISLFLSYYLVYLMIRLTVIEIITTENNKMTKNLNRVSHDFTVVAARLEKKYENYKLALILIVITEIITIY